MPFRRRFKLGSGIRLRFPLMALTSLTCFFADDVLLFAKATSSQAKMMAELFTNFSVQSMCFFMHPNAQDGFFWEENSDGTYSTKSGYIWLQSKRGGADLTKPWSSVWKLHGPEKVRFFIWLAWHGSLPTLQVLHRRGIVQSETCTRCGVVEETIMHCVRDCHQ